MRTIILTMSFFMAIGGFFHAMSEKLPVLFLSSRVNYAWGYVHEGFLIDSSGDIRNYSFTRADSIKYVNSSDTLPSRIYEQLFAKSTPTGKKVNADTLLSMQALLESAGTGVLTFNGRCKDAGMYRYSAFIYDSLNSRQKEIICYQMGDKTACNSSDAARAIARWLNSIDSVNISSCAPSDSCLHPVTGILPIKQPFPGMVHPVSPATFHLNGKKVKNPARQLIVGKDGKVPIDFKQVSPDRN